MKRKKPSKEVQKAYEVIQRCVDAVPIKPIPKNLKDFRSSIVVPVRNPSRKK